MMHQHTFLNSTSKTANNSKYYSRISKILWGSCVAFTSLPSAPDVGQEAESWQILTSEWKTWQMSDYIKFLSKNFHNKFQNRYWYDVNFSRPTKDDCDYIVKLIRGDFDTTYTNLNELNDNDRLIQEFTNEQFNVLDISNFNDRCLFEGSAGTGKTVLALELFKRLSNKDNKVGLFCYNKKLGSTFTAWVEKMQNEKLCFGGHLHEFLLRSSNVIPNNSHAFYSEELPLEFIIQNESTTYENKFDYLIIDEAQDLISPYYLEVFDLILKGGLRSGKWTFWGDFSNQSIFANLTREELIGLLAERSDFVRTPPLKINCRNTKLIARYCTLLTGANIPDFIHGGIEGKSVIQRFPSTNSFVSTVEEILIDLKAKNLPFSDVVMLSPIKFESSPLANSKEVINAISDGLEVYTIQAFKGLEKNIVIIHSFAQLNNDEAIRLLYVAITRARQVLYMVINKNLESDFKHLIHLNANKI